MYQLPTANVTMYHKHELIKENQIKRAGETPEVPKLSGIPPFLKEVGADRVTQNPTQ